MDDAGYVTQDGEQDVDEKVTTASSLEEDTQRWEDDGDDDLADISEEELSVYKESSGRVCTRFSTVLWRGSG